MAAMNGRSVIGSTGFNEKYAIYWSGVRKSAGSPRPRRQSLAKTISCKPLHAGVVLLQLPPVTCVSRPVERSFIRTCQVAPLRAANSRRVPSGEIEGVAISDESSISVFTRPESRAIAWIDEEVPALM